VQKEHDPLVHLFSFVLAKDRYHLGLVPAEKDGIPLYMQKLNLGFAKYYNLKNKRRGTLFEGRFKAVSIVNPKQLASVVKYINIKIVLDQYNQDTLLKYPYSSFSDLFSNRNSHLVSQDSRETLLGILGEEFFTSREDYSLYIESLHEDDKRLLLEV